jgi:hypothetical protein
MLLNRPNILSWFTGLTKGQYLPSPHITKECGNTHIIWVVGELLSFYINENIATSTNSLTLVSVGDNTATSISLTVPNVFVAQDLQKYRYASIPCPSVLYGTYQLRLVVGSNTYYSTLIDVVSAEDAAKSTAFFKFRNKFTRHKIYYPYSELTSFYQQFRLRCSFISSEQRVEKETFFDSDSNLPREFNQKDAYQLDRYMADGIASMLAHDFLEINGKRYRVEGALNLQPFGKNGLANGEVLLEDLELNSFRRV